MYVYVYVCVLYMCACMHASVVLVNKINLMHCMVVLITNVYSTNKLTKMNIGCWALLIN